MFDLIMDGYRYKREDSIEHLPYEKVVDELKYMGIETLGEFKDKFEVIMARIVDRFPSFFYNEDFTQEHIADFLEGVE